MSRRIGVVTVARSDYGIYRSVLDAIRAHPGLELGMYVSGAHLSADFGLTVREIEAQGDPIVARIEMLLASDSPEGVAKAMGLGQIGFAQAFTAARPDILLVLGDRFEMFAAVAAALPFNIPVAHIHGGELTYGAIDDAIRHAITKLAHLHFPATRDYAERIIAMGEEPWRVHATGAPALDKIAGGDFPGREALETQFGVSFDPAPLLCTFHPVTREFEQAAAQTGTLCAALDEIDVPVIFTMPNADTGGRAVRAVLSDYAQRRDDVRLIENFGFLNYFGALKLVRAMVGNSSSALIEAPGFALPAVNIGRRQEGRTRAANVIDVDCEREAIANALRRAIDPGFRAALRGQPNPYGDGTASVRIVEVLAGASLDDRLTAKRFHDAALPAAQPKE